MSDELKLFDEGGRRVEKLDNELLYILDNGNEKKEVTIKHGISKFQDRHFIIDLEDESLLAAVRHYDFGLGLEIFRPEKVDYEDYRKYRAKEAIASLYTTEYIYAGMPEAAANEKKPSASANPSSTPDTATKTKATENLEIAKPDIEGLDLSEPAAEKSPTPKTTPAPADAAPPVGEKDEEAKKDPAAVAADEKANAIKTIMNFKWREDDGILLSSPKNTKQEIEELKKALFSHGGVNSEIVEQKDVGKFQLIIRDPENLQKAKKVLDGLGVKQSESSPLTVLKNALLEVVSHGPVGREKAGITKDGITKITTTQAWSDAVMPTEIGGNYDYDKAAQGIAGFIGKMSDKMVNSYRFTAPAALGLFAFNAPALGVAVCLIAAGAVAGKIIRTINDSHIEYNVKDSKSETLGLVEAFKGNFDVEAKAANIAGKTLAYGGFALGATGVVAAGITAVGLPLMVAAVATVAGFSAVGYAGMKVKKEYDSFANAITESRKKPVTIEK